MTRTTLMSLAGFALTFLAGGCAASRVSPSQFASRQVPGASRSNLFTAARQTLVKLGYRLDQVDAIAGVITAEPTDAELQERTAQTRATLSTPGRERRVVDIRLIEGADGPRVHCRVSIQLLTTEAHRMFRHDRPGTDIPHETAIDLDAAANAAQNSVWKTVRRDKSAERQILDAIVRTAGA